MCSIRISEDKIYINNVPEKIISGAMHYFRVVPEYWYDRLLKLKEMGCNCVETYLCWNLHEKREGEFDFSGWLDFSAFLKTAQELGLYAIVRPGPYICSEWDFGGMPWWLLKDRNMSLRCFDPLFLEKLTPYLENVCSILKNNLITNGGNVIFVQIENEYGAFGNDKEYLRWIKAFYEQHGIDCPFITSDGETEYVLKNGSLPDVMASVNYRWDSVRCIGALKKYFGGQPGAVMELWNGRAMHWGEKFERRDIDEVAKSLETALDNAELVNLYMFHGGTNFGFMNGSLDFGAEHTVQMTSYDVDAPLDEFGRRTKKYYAEQQVISKHTGKEIVNTATDTCLKEYKDIKYIGEASLSQYPELLKLTKSSNVKTMEDCDAPYGYIIYSTDVLVCEQGATITLPPVHDIAHVYINGEYFKTFYRNQSDMSFEISDRGNHKIQILVENMGRVNYGVYLADRKGLDGDIIVHDNEYNVTSKTFGFDIYTLGLEKLPEKIDGKAENNAPAFYEYEFYADECCDTLLVPEGFGRGVAFINGINLGRHWNIENSENKLFIPAPFIKKGKNKIVIFDVLASESDKKVSLCSDE